MSAAGPRKYLAKIQAKDEEAKLEMNITADTTIRELLRYWDWRSGGETDAIGFLIDISVAKGKIAKAPEIRPVTSNSKPDVHNGAKRPAGPSPPFDGRPPTKRATLPALGTSSRHKTVLTRVDVDVDDYDDAGEPSGSTSKDMGMMKLDPKAGFQISVQFPDKTKVPIHIIETNTLEKIGRSACKVVKMDFEKMKFSFVEQWGEVSRYLPYRRKGSKIRPIYVRLEKTCNMTAKDCGLIPNSVLCADPSDSDVSPRLSEVQTQITGTALPDADRSSSSITEASVPATAEGTSVLPGVPGAGTRTSQRIIGEKPSKDSFRITVSFLTGRVIHCEIRPNTNLRKICRAVAEEFGTPFEMMRFIFENVTMVSGRPEEVDYSANVLRLRDPNADEYTAEDWGLKEGDEIYGIVCLCGC